MLSLAPEPGTVHHKYGPDTVRVGAAYSSRTEAEANLPKERPGGNDDVAFEVQMVKIGSRTRQSIESGYHSD
jgi:hypothetical protein